jgi:hypothetical protein
MGTWGFNVLQDDVAADVYDGYMRRFNLKMSHRQIVEELGREYADQLADEDDGPIVWLAIAKAQWDCGALWPGILDRVREIIEQGQGLNRWAEAGDRELARRCKALSAFLARLQTGNPRPRKPRKPVQRKPVFQPGDCLAIRLSDGNYAAALVLENPPERAGPGDETYGINLIGLLEYKSAKKPGPAVFESRNWLKLTHHSWCGELWIVNVMALRFRGARDCFEVVAHIPLRPDDPKQEHRPLGGGAYAETFRTYAGWDFAKQVVLQDKWNRGECHA